MSSDEAFFYLCGVYERRPRACRDYPFRDAQVLFPSCVFVEGDRVLSYEEAVALRAGAEAVEAACRRCGKCCYGWSRCGDDLRPVVRCEHLVRVPSRGEQESDPDHARMNSVTDILPFGELEDL